MSGTFNRWAMRVEPTITGSLKVAAMVVISSILMGMVWGALYGLAYGITYVVDLPTLPVFAAIVLMWAALDMWTPSPPKPADADGYTRFGLILVQLAKAASWLWAFFYLISLFVPKGA